MRYTLLVLSSPDSGSSARHALEFAKAVRLAKHDVACVFFYDAGVLTALSQSEPASDEYNVRLGWQEFAQQTETRLIACVASALRFGIGDGQALRDRCLPEFSIAGLGELVEARSASHRFMTFAD